MKIHYNFRGNYNHDPVRVLGFEKYQNFKKKLILFLGIGYNFKEGRKEFSLKNKDTKMVQLQLEEPNRFFSSENSFDYEKNIYKVLTLCPYTAKWKNKLEGYNRRIPIFFPFNEDLIPKNFKKDFDVIYAGTIYSTRLINIVKILSRFKYRIVSITTFGKFAKFIDIINKIFSKVITLRGYKIPFLSKFSEFLDNLTSKFFCFLTSHFSRNKLDRLITNRGCSYEEKLDLMSRSRITIVQNILDIKDDQIENLKKIPQIQNNPAFKRVFSKNPELITPQIKSRVFEAAFCKSLILCQKDPFNIIERFFVPGKEFVYYKDLSDLEIKIKKIIENWPKYKEIAENAYTRAVREYTTRAFYEKFLKDLDN